MNKSGLLAFLLSFLPGAGFAYLGRSMRAAVYGIGFFGPMVLLFPFAITDNIIEEIAILTVLFMAAVWVINMFDMLIAILSGNLNGRKAPVVHHPYGGYAENEFAAAAQPIPAERQQEKSRAILLSLIPGLGHMSLGMMQRGITFLISFVGLFAIIIFLAMIMHRAELLIFLLVLPVIWIYSMFDAIQHVHAKQRGEALVDRSLFEELESNIASGRKNKVLAIALSIFPGAGHLYLGLQKRGLQLMGGFLITIYIMDNMRLSLFFFLLPLFWCFSFFDAVQQTSRYERGELEDDPVLQQFVPYQKWFGIALIVLGVYYLLNGVVTDFIREYFTREIYQSYLNSIYVLPTVLVSFLLIFIGLRLTFGSKARAPKQLELPAPPRPEEEIR